MSKRYSQKHSLTRSKQSSKPSNVLVDVVIPVYNRFDCLQDCLQSLRNSTGSFEFHPILVDNGSEGKEADDFYPRWSGWAKVIRNKHNLGFPKACNQGAKAGSAPLLFFLNSDVVLEPDALNQLVAALDDPSVGVAGAKLLFSESSPHGPAGKVQHVGLCANLHGDIKHILMGWPADHPKVLAVKDVLGVTGAALMVRRSIFEKVRGFDEVYGTGTYEDVDFCLKAHALNQRVVVCQEAVGTHYVGATATKYGVDYPLTLNNLIFKGKWVGQYPWTEWLYS